MKIVHGHKRPSRIERLLPMERLVELFEEKFSEPYFNPTAELTFSELATAFPDVQQADLEEALSHWVDHSGEKTLQTKLVDADGATLGCGMCTGFIPRTSDSSTPNRVRFSPETLHSPNTEPVAIETARAKLRSKLSEATLTAFIQGASEARFSPFQRVKSSESGCDLAPQTLVE